MIKKTDPNNIDKTIVDSDFTPYVDDISRFEPLLNKIPIGILVPFIPTNEAETIGNLNAYLSDFNMVICDGSQFLDADSPIFNVAGRYLPNLTDNRFLCGYTSAGTIVAGPNSGSNFLDDHTHPFSLSTSPVSYVNTISSAHSHGSASVPSQNGGHSHTHNCYYSNDSDGGDDDGILQWNNGSGYGYFIVDSSSHVHYHSWYGDSVSSTSFSISHSHTLVITGTVGSGLAPILTDKRPQFLSCYFILKHKDFTF